jgi:disulfide bond formation protein DsbB
MSQHQTRSDDSINANVVAFVITTFVVLISILLISQLPRNTVGQKVAMAEATVEALPSVTPLPPTPTTTVIPSAIPTELPAAAATSAPAVMADAGQTNPANTSSSDYDPALIGRGQQQFMLCAACHGPDGRGLPNLGKDLVASDFVHSLSDEDLLTFVKTGRPIWDPLNTTGIDMPPKGGNPAMTDEDILAVIAYVRSLSASGG